MHIPPSGRASANAHATGMAEPTANASPMPAHATTITRNRGRSCRAASSAPATEPRASAELNRPKCSAPRWNTTVHIAAMNTGKFRLNVSAIRMRIMTAIRSVRRLT